MNLREKRAAAPATSPPHSQGYSSLDNCLSSGGTPGQPGEAALVQISTASAQVAINLAAPAQTSGAAAGPGSNSNLVAAAAQQLAVAAGS